MKMDLHSILVTVLILAFAGSSWLGINSIWVQLPLIVPSAPESWNLPAWLSVLAQIGNVGPLLYGVCKYFAPDFTFRKTHWFISGVMLTGFIAMVFFAIFWNKHVEIGGKEWSVPLFILTLFIAMSNCASNVVCLPYIGRFNSAKYLTVYFIGMGLSGFLPSIMALIQGAGAVNCVLVNGTMEAESTPPLFSAQAYFFISAGLIAVSLTAFLLLHYKFLVSHSASDLAPKTNMAVSQDSACGGSSSQDDNRNKSVQMLKLDEDAAPGALRSVPSMTKKKLFLLTGIIIWICIFMDAVLPSIQSYTAMPYGRSAYHFAAIGSGFTGPIGTITSLIVRPKRRIIFYATTTAATILTTYVMVLAFLSPTPPMYQNVSGAVLMVGAWAVCFALFSFIRASIAERLRVEGGERYLFWCGVLIQFGSFLGAVIVFPFVSILHVLHGAPQCS